VGEGFFCLKIRLGMFYSWQMVFRDAQNARPLDDFMAERVGFEPTSPVLPGYPLSRRALSTAQTPLRGCSFTSLANAPTAHNLMRATG
jgi:hypothetical protein